MEQHEEASDRLIKQLERDNYDMQKRLHELEAWAWKAHEYLDWLSKNGYYTADSLRAEYVTITLSKEPSNEAS